MHQAYEQHHTQNYMRKACNILKTANLNNFIKRLDFFHKHFEFQFFIKWFYRSINKFYIFTQDFIILKHCVSFIILI